jgi:hypothetical protein
MANKFCFLKFLSLWSSFSITYLEELCMSSNAIKLVFFYFSKVLFLFPKVLQLLLKHLLFNFKNKQDKFCVKGQSQFCFMHNYFSNQR